MAPVLSPRPGERPPGPDTEPSLGTVAPGRSITLYGRWYFDVCQDTVPFGGTLTPATPRGQVPLTLVPGDGRALPLVVAHPDANGSFTVVARVPVDAPLGPATIRDDEGHTVGLVVSDP